MIQQGKDIAGYWFMGEGSDLIDNYGTRYPEKKYHINFEFVKESKVAQEDIKCAWCFEEKAGRYWLKTFERKLEAFYYLDLYPARGEDKEKLFWLEYAFHSGIINRKWGDFRAELSTEVYENKVFCYKIAVHTPYEVFYSQPYVLDKKYNIEGINATIWL